MGLRELWFGLLARTCYRRLWLVELDLEEIPPVPPPRAPLSFGFLGEPELAEYARFRPDDAASARERFARGERCLAARSDGAIVSARWIASGEAVLEYLGRRLRLAPDEAFVHAAYTSPAFRGRGIAAACIHEYARRLRAEGHRRVLAAVGPENVPAIRSQARAGYRRMGTIGWVGVGPWRRHFLRADAGPLRRSRT